VVKFTESTNNNNATNNAQQMLNKLIESDKNIYVTLLKLAPVVKQLRATGAIDSNTLTLYKSLLQRLASRQEAFIKTKIVEVKTGQLKGYDNEKKELAELWEAIGIAPLIIGIIIGVIVAVSAAATCYYAFKPNYEDSKADFILSKELDTTLRKKLTAAEYTQLHNEGEKNVDDAYNTGKNEGKVSLVAKAAFFLGGFWLFDRFILSTKKGK
jgi:predicted HNH restriction endonuclease